MLIAAKADYVENANQHSVYSPMISVNNQKFEWITITGKILGGKSEAYTYIN